MIYVVQVIYIDGEKRIADIDSAWSNEDDAIKRVSDINSDVFESGYPVGWSAVYERLELNKPKIEL